MPDMIAQFEAIKLALDSLSPQVFHGRLFRACKPRYLKQPDLAINGKGSYDHGGRWNLVRRHVVYASLDHRTCFEEAIQTSYAAEVPSLGVLPITLFEFQVKLKLCVRLEHLDWQSVFGFKFEAVSEQDWLKTGSLREATLSQLIGESAFQLGIEALIVPSCRRDTGHNIVIFRKNLQIDSQIEILNYNEINNSLE